MKLSAKRLSLTLLIPLAGTVFACGSDSVDEAVLATRPVEVQLCYFMKEYRECGAFSELESVPVPENARPLETLEWEKTQTSYDDGKFAEAFAFEVPGWSIDDLKAWYEAQMPTDAPYKGYQPCDVIEGDTLMVSANQGRQRQDIFDEGYDTEIPEFGEDLGGQHYFGPKWQPDELDESDVISTLISEPVETRTWAKFEPVSEPPQRYLYVEQLSVSLGDGALPQILLETAEYAVATEEVEVRPGVTDERPEEDPSNWVVSEFNFAPDAVSPECASQAPPIPSS